MLWLLAEKTGLNCGFLRCEAPHSVPGEIVVNVAALEAIIGKMSYAGCGAAA